LKGRVAEGAMRVEFDPGVTPDEVASEMHWLIGKIKHHGVLQAQEEGLVADTDSFWSEWVVPGVLRYRMNFEEVECG